MQREVSKTSQRVTIREHAPGKSHWFKDCWPNDERPVDTLECSVNTTLIDPARRHPMVVITGRQPSGLNVTGPEHNQKQWKARPGFQNVSCSFNHKLKLVS
jgi:hypothetical protein